MSEKMRVMTEKPLNAETPVPSLRSWITANNVFFDRNQGAIMEKEIPLALYRLTVDGEVETVQTYTFDEIIALPKVIAANTMECSGNGRSLLKEKASGNPWTIGGVGNAVWGGIWLKTLLEKSGLTRKARHVAFEGMDKPLGSAGIKFSRSIPVEKAMTSTLLAYEMNGEPLPLKHGYPLRAVALGWTGANCVKWLNKITVMDRPYEGFFMDKVYRVFQKGEDPKSGTVVTGLSLKSIITKPLHGATLSPGTVVILGAAYGGEADIAKVEVSVDGGKEWHQAEFLGPHEPFAWRQWQFLWEAGSRGEHSLMARAIDSEEKVQPPSASWNVLGYGNNGVEEHAVTVHIA